MPVIKSGTVGWNGAQVDDLLEKAVLAYAGPFSGILGCCERSQVAADASPIMCRYGEQASHPDTLDLIEAHLVLPAVVELRRAGAGSLRAIQAGSLALTHHDEIRRSRCGFLRQTRRLLPMSLTTHRPATTGHMDFRADERRRLVAWADKNRLEVSIKPGGAGRAGGMVFIGYGEGVAHWTIYRADGHLWLCCIEDRTEQGREGSKVAVGSVEDALARIMVDTKA